jgi:hypothetical protein
MKKSNKASRRAVLYIRAASQDQHDQHRGITEQRAVCAREAGRLGAEVIDEFTDTGSAR